MVLLHDGAGPAVPLPPPAAGKKTRTRTGCLNCRRKKRKCDEARPACGACARRKQPCEWGIRLSFREENAQGLGPEHPSMNVLAGKMWHPGEFSILDVTQEIMKDYIASPPGDPGCGGMFVHSPAKDEAAAAAAARKRKRSEASAASASLQSPASTAATPGKPATPGRSPKTTRHADSSAVASLLYLSQGGQPQQQQQLTSPPQQQRRKASVVVAAAAAVPPTPLNNFPSGYIHTMQVFTPDGSSGSLEDGVFLPGSAYHEWHSTLRNRLIQEVRSNAPTRAGSPSSTSHPTHHGGPSSSQDDNSSSETGSQHRLSAIHDGLSSAEPEPSFIPSAEECGLWRTWFDEVSPWLDKFDNDRHFQHILPTMAPHHPHLRLSILALSARQMELKGTAVSADSSLALYQEAIHQLLPHLPERNTAVIASCVILCVLEMLSCSPKAWQRHLDGCASLMEAVGIDGFVGGVNQALFWCFARMDVCGGLISSVKTLIPVSHWAPGTDLASDVEAFETITDFAGWANYAVYLMAQVTDLLNGDNSSLARQSRRHHDPEPLSRTSPEYADRWAQLWRYICDWHDKRPAPLLPTMTVPSATPASPFPTIIFSNPAAISGNQLHHTAALLMLQNQPPAVRTPDPKPRSILWHARRICAISISNDHHGAWTNSIQPLWIAGRCMSNPTEHRAILDLLDKIERESGWGAKWRADDLKAFWGDLEE